MRKRLFFLIVVALSMLPMAINADTWTFEWNTSKNNGGQGFYNFGSSLVEKEYYTTELNGLQWNASAEGTYVYAFTSSGQYIGFGSQPASSAKMWTTGLEGKIKSVKVTSRVQKAENAGNVAVTVNDKAYQCGGMASAAMSETYAVYDFTTTDAQEGKIEISLNQTSETKGPLYVKKIEIEYEPITSSVAAPVFTPAAGTYDVAQNVAMTVTGLEAGNYKIYYTTDGSNPRLADGTRKEYTSPVAVTATTTLKAATVVGEETSVVTEGKYVIRKDPQIRFNKDAITLVTGEDAYSDLLNPNKVSPITYKSSAPLVCSVDKYGELTSSYVTADATAIITASFAGNEEYYPATAQMTVTVTAKTPLKAPVVTPQGGTFSEPVQVTVTTDDPEAVTIWYSTTAQSAEDFEESDNTQSTVVEGNEATFTIDKSCTLYVMTRGYNVNSPVVSADFVVNLPLKADFTTDKATVADYDQEFDSPEELKDWTVGNGWGLDDRNFKSVNSDDKYSIYVQYEGSGSTTLVSPELTIKEGNKVEFYAYFGPMFLVYGKWTFNVVNTETNESEKLLDAFAWAQETAYNSANWNKFSFDISKYAGKKVKFVFDYPFGGESLAIDAFRIVRDDPTAASTIHIFEGEAIEYKSMASGYPEQYEWAFPGGDVESSTEENPVVKYSKAGTYDVALTVKRGEESDRMERKGFVVVSQKAPEALIGLPEEGYESPFVGVFVPLDVPVTFKDLSKGNPNEWRWVFQNANVESSTEQNPTVTFVKKGTVSVGLTAKNEAGQANDILQYAIQAGGAQFVWNISTEENSKLQEVELGFYGKYAGSNFLGMDKFAEKYKAPLADAKVDSVGVYFSSVAAIDQDTEITLTVNAVGADGAPGEVLATAKRKVSELKYSDTDYLRTDFILDKSVALKKGTEFFVVVGPMPNESMDSSPYTSDDVAIFCLRRAVGEKTTSWHYLENQDDMGNPTGGYTWYENVDDPVSMAIAPVVSYDTEATGINQVTGDRAGDAKVVAIYTVDGIEVREMIPGNIYIVKYSDGTSSKMIGK